MVDLETGVASRLSKESCRLSYRSSRFKEDWAGRFVVTGLTLTLEPGAPGSLRYGNLAEDFADPLKITPGQVRERVLEIRRSKSMVLDPDDPNRRSAGSFFVNPVLEENAALAARERVGLLRGKEAALSMPYFSAGSGRIKLSAAWLIEAAGFHKGYCLGNAGLSTCHVLALINRGGAGAADLLELAGRIRRRVRQAFGVTLHPEPRFLGFRRSIDELLG